MCRFDSIAAYVVGRMGHGSLLVDLPTPEVTPGRGGRLNLSFGIYGLSTLSHPILPQGVFFGHFNTVSYYTEYNTYHLTAESPYWASTYWAEKASCFSMQTQQPTSHSPTHRIKIKIRQTESHEGHSLLSNCLRIPHAQCRKKLPPHPGSSQAASQINQAHGCCMTGHHDRLGLPAVCLCSAVEMQVQHSALSRSFHGAAAHPSVQTLLPKGRRSMPAFLL
jgi:hypothetical protein